jgi:hypothetical protein
MLRALVAVVACVALLRPTAAIVFNGSVIVSTTVISANQVRTADIDLDGELTQRLDVSLPCCPPLAVCASAHLCVY